MALLSRNKKVRVANGTTMASTTAAPKDSKKRRGCLNVSVVALAMLGIFIFAGLSFYNSMTSALGNLGLSLPELKEMFTQLNKPVNEQELSHNTPALTEADYAAMRNIISGGFTPAMPEFGFFDSEGNLVVGNFAPPNGSKNTVPLTLDNTDIRALLNNIFKSSDPTLGSYLSLLSIISLDTSVIYLEFNESGGMLNVAATLRLDLTRLKQDAGQLLGLLSFIGINLPDTAYITSEITLDISDPQEYEVVSSVLKVNQLNTEDTRKVLEPLISLIYGSGNKTAAQFAYEAAQDVCTLLLDLQGGWGANFSYGTNAVSITKA